MPRAIAILLLFLCILLPSAGKRDRVVIGFHAEGGAEEGSKFVMSPIPIGNPPRKVHFRLVPEISTKQIQAFYAFPAEDGSYGVAFKLIESGQLTLNALSSSQHGKYLLTTFNNQAVSYVLIDRKVSDGVIVVWSGVGEKDLAVLRKKLQEVRREGAEDPAPKKKPFWKRKKKDKKPKE